MDRVLRIAGVVVLLTAGLSSWLLFDRTVTGDNPTPASTATASTATGAATGTAGAGRAGEGGWDPWTFDGERGVDLSFGESAGSFGESAGSFGESAGSFGESAGSFGESAERPDRLALRPGLASKPYGVGGLPGSRDRDVELKWEYRPYPIETDLFPYASLASIIDIEPGLYATAFDRKGCGYELLRYDQDGVEKVIGHDRVTEGRLLVTLNGIEPDNFVPQPQCGRWSPWSPAVEPLVVAGPGDYWIGDLARGVWTVPEGCFWEEVVGFRGARLADVVASGRGPQTLVVDDETMGLRVRDCRRPLVLSFPHHRPSERLN